MSVSLQIPVLFDVSANGTVFGQDSSGVDLFDAHLKFNVVGSANSSLTDEFKKILYADPSENFVDGSGVLFFSNGTGLSSGLGTTIRTAILGETSKLEQPTGTTNADGTTDSSKRYKTPGIPLPNYAVDYSGDAVGAAGWEDKYANSLNTAQKYYTGGLTDSGGTSFGRILIRLMATHLMGHPFAQDFIANEAAIIKDISDCDITAQIDAKLFKHESSFFTQVKGHTELQAATGPDASGNFSAAKDNGICNTILFSLYETLLGSAPDRFDLSGNLTSGGDVSDNDHSPGTDASGGNLDPGTCRPRPLPFRTGDTLSFYFRPIVQIKIGNNDSTTASYGYDEISGVGTSSFSGTSLTEMFFNPRHRWISHASAAAVNKSSKTTESEAGAEGNWIDSYSSTTAGDTSAGGLMMTGTNLVHNTYGGSPCVLFDGHVWRVQLTMG